MAMATSARMAKIITMVIQMTMATRAKMVKMMKRVTRVKTIAAMTITMKVATATTAKIGTGGTIRYQETTPTSVPFRGVRDGSHHNSKDRDMRDDRIPRDKAPFYPVSGRQEWITSQQKATVNRTGGGLKVCLACQTIMLPSVKDVLKGMMERLLCCLTS